MIASPIYLSIVPSFSKITSVIGVKYSLRTFFNSVAVSFSEIPVNPTLSEKGTVISRISPSNPYLDKFVSIWLTSSVGIYWLNACFNLRRPLDSIRKPYKKLYAVRLATINIGDTIVKTSPLSIHSQKLIATKAINIINA